MAQVEVITAKQLEQFEKMLISNPEMKAKVKKVLSSVLAQVRSSVAKDTHAILGNDPRAAYKAVKRSVYKRILGGSVSILNKKKASSTRVNVKHESIYDTQPWHRGGNRRPRSNRTDEVDSYYGSDRGFILRFLNNGTDFRTTRYGNRGQITPIGWFGRDSKYHMEKQSQIFCDIIDKEINNILNQHG